MAHRECAYVCLKMLSCPVALTACFPSKTVVWNYEEVLSALHVEGRGAVLCYLAGHAHRGGYKVCDGAVCHLVCRCCMPPRVSVLCATSCACGGCDLVCRCCMPPRVSVLYATSCVSAACDLVCLWWVWLDASVSAMGVCTLCLFVGVRV